jgi:hypothetical protein
MTYCQGAESGWQLNGFIVKCSVPPVFLASKNKVQNSQNGDYRRRRFKKMAAIFRRGN